MATIVVGVDGSEPSRNALRWAVQEAKLRAATVVALHAWTIPEAPSMYRGLSINESEVETLQQGAREFVERAVEEAVPDAAVDILPIAVEGSAAAALLAVARTAELVVVGSRGLGGFKGLFLGSVSQHVAHHARCPVVVIGTGVPRPQPPLRSAPPVARIHSSFGIAAAETAGKASASISSS